MLIAMRFHEPMVLIATGNGDTTPLTVGFSMSSAFPPPGDFISRSASSVNSNSVATGKEMRFSSPAFSSAATKSEKESKAMNARSVRGGGASVQASGLVRLLAEQLRLRPFLQEPPAAG